MIGTNFTDCGSFKITTLDDTHTQLNRLPSVDEIKELEALEETNRVQVL